MLKKILGLVISPKEWLVRGFTLNKSHKWFWSPFREKCPNMDIFLSVFSRIQSKYEKIRTRKTPYLNTFRVMCWYSEFSWCVIFSYSVQSKYLYSVRMWENTEKENSEYRQFLRSCTTDQVLTVFLFYMLVSK